MDTPVLDWCPSEHFDLRYEGLIRDGQFGILSKEPKRVWNIEGRKMAVLWPFPKIDYQSEQYRISVNGSSDVEHYLALHRAQQAGYMKILKRYLSEGASVADCGCGGGALLDEIKQVSGGCTVAIEPFEGYHLSLKDRGHKVFNDILTATQNCCAGMDLALSIHVIEHVEDPVSYLRDILSLTKTGGRLVVITPNLNDVLLDLIPDKMNPFFFRMVHNYYFCSESLAWVAELAGWKCEEKLHYHEFGLSNTLLWIRDGIPSGHQRLETISAEADSWWKSYMEKTGQSNNVGVVLVKP